MNRTKKLTIIAFVLIIIGTIGSLLTYNLLDRPDFIAEEKIIQDDNITEIDIRADNAKINLMPSEDGSVKVMLTGRARTKDNLSVNTADDRLSIGLNNEESKKIFNIGVFEPDFELSVYIPERQYEAIYIDLDNGGIKASQIQADYIEANSANGIIEMGGISADEVKVNSENGKLILWDIKGKITGESANGMISLKTDRLDSPVQLESDNGTIEIHTNNEPTNVTFDAETQNGRIDILGDNNGNLRIGDGENLIRLRTSNGSIVVSQDR